MRWKQRCDRDPTLSSLGPMARRGFSFDGDREQEIGQQNERSASFAGITHTGKYAQEAEAYPEQLQAP